MPKFNIKNWRDKFLNEGMGPGGQNSTMGKPAKVKVMLCPPFRSMYPNGSQPSYYPKLTIDNQTPTVGQVFKIDWSAQGTYVPPGAENMSLKEWTVLEVMPVQPSGNYYNGTEIRGCSPNPVTGTTTDYSDDDDILNLGDPADSERP